MPQQRQTFAHEIGMREAIVSSLGWVAVAVAFGIGVLVVGGGTEGGEYFASYVIEKALFIAGGQALLDRFSWML